MSYYPPAFPLAASEYGGNGPEYGMTLRDYFAAHVDTSGVPISAFEALIGDFPSTGNPMQIQDWFAKGEAAYKFHRADAMLAARNK